MAAEAALAMAAVSAVGSVSGGYAQAKGLAQQAAFTKQQARSEALKYKQQGVAVLDNILKTQASIVAAAGAGGIDPYSGSPLFISQQALAKGAGEFYLSEDGQIISTRTGDLKAQQLMAQGKQAIMGGWTSAATTLASAGFSYARLGAAPSGGLTASYADLSSNPPWFVE